MKLSFECEVPSLSQAERDALGKVVRDAISRFLFLQIGKPFTDSDLELLREMHISA